MPILQKLDVYALMSLYQMSITSKSAAIALALLYKGDDELTLQEAVSIARLDVDY